MSVYQFGPSELEMIMSVVIKAWGNLYLGSRDIPKMYAANDQEVAVQVKRWARENGLVKQMVVIGHENARAFNDRYPDEQAENLALDVSWARIAWAGYGFGEIDLKHAELKIGLLRYNLPDDADRDALEFVITAYSSLLRLKSHKAKGWA